MEMSTIKNVVITAVALGGVFLLYMNRKHFLGKQSLPKGNRNKVFSEAQSDDAMTCVYKAYLMYADNFQGLYEPMYKASIGAISQERVMNVLREWNIRMSRIINIPIELKGWWSTIIADIDVLPYSELQMRSREIIKMIEGCGIVRDNRSEFIADNDTNQYYQNDDCGKFVTGQKLRVETPCWYLPCNPVRIIEKGYCEIL